MNFTILNNILDQTNSMIWYTCSIFVQEAVLLLAVLSMTTAQVRGGLSKRRQNSATVNAKYPEVLVEASETYKIQNRILKHKEDKAEKEERLRRWTRQKRWIRLRRPRRLRRPSRLRRKKRNKRRIRLGRRTRECRKKDEEDEVPMFVLQDSVVSWIIQQVTRLKCTPFAFYPEKITHKCNLTSILTCNL
jgi:hypothetical protein